MFRISLLLILSAAGVLGYKPTMTPFHKPAAVKRLQDMWMQHSKQSTVVQPISTKQGYVDNIHKTGRILAGIVGASALSTLAGASNSFARSVVTAPAPSGSGVDFAAVRNEIAKVYKIDTNRGPTLVRLAWHSSGTYDKMSHTGGSYQGTMRFKEELAHGANAGLNAAVDWLEPIHEKFQGKGLSYADLYTLAGVEAIKLMGGPQIGWRAGRVDSMDPADVTPDGRLPAADKGSPEATAKHLRDIFGRMGFGDRDIVALSGAHALGRCHAESSGYVGPWTPTPTSFNNLYFSLLMNLKWTPNETAAKFQYQDPSGKLMMLPSDIVLIQDPKFKRYVNIYANDQAIFFADFAVAFQKLEELGTKNLYAV